MGGVGSEGRAVGLSGREDVKNATGDGGGAGSVGVS